MRSCSTSSAPPARASGAARRVKGANRTTSFRGAWAVAAGWTSPATWWPWARASSGNVPVTRRRTLVLFPGSSCSWWLATANAAWPRISRRKSGGCARSGRCRAHDSGLRKPVRITRIPWCDPTRPVLVPATEPLHAIHRKRLECHRQSVSVFLAGNRDIPHGVRYGDPRNLATIPS